MLYFSLCLIALFVLTGVNCERKEKRPRIILNDGIIEGKKGKTVDKGNTFYSFQGIPYAKSPIGDLRFAPPQPPDQWSGVLDGSKPANTCIGMYFENGGEEDCLYLNIFTPALDKSLPVIVWIHGGSFTFVYEHYTLNGTDFFIDEDVIFVTVHYRLGVFGFLSTEDDVIPGNFGLKDQLMAITWVHDNIAAFGGDPTRITLMGQSSGATATGYMGIVPQLQGKIAGIIQQSGTAISEFSLGRYSRVGAYALSTSMGLQTQNSSEILEMLRRADPVDLRNKSLTTYIDILYGLGPFHSLLYVPVMESRTNDNPLITEMSYEQLKKGTFNRVPRLIGITSLEGMLLIDEFQSKIPYYQNYDQMIRRYVPFSMNTRNEEVGYLIKKHYTHGTPFTSNISNMVHYGTDEHFVRPILKDASLVSKYVSTYLYEFSYQGKLGYPQKRPLNGVDHGEDLSYLFYNPNRGRVSKKDKVMRRKLVRLWSNFAKYGKPTPVKEDLLDNQIWLPINPVDKDIHYMDIGEKLVSSANPHPKDVKFWDDLYVKYGNPPFDTY